jgi:D-tyrosyl-tRNA(Tyr) deacylase
MRAVVQRVKSAAVHVEGRITGEIGQGLLVLVGVGRGDGEKDITYLASKLPELRIFEDTSGKFNLSLKEVGGRMLVVSQFTLYGDCRKGRRPSFIEAAEPAEAKRLYEQLILKLRGQGVSVETGEFQAKMEVRLINDGPVTILLDSRTNQIIA